MLSVGTGFLSHAENATLRERLSTGALPLSGFFGQLLRLVYRLIFLLAAEDRNLLHAPDASAAARKLYAEGYSVGSLARPRGATRGLGPAPRPLGRSADHLCGACRAASRGLACPRWMACSRAASIPDLEAAKLANRSLMEAIYRLAWLKEDSGLHTGQLARHGD